MIGWDKANDLEITTDVVAYAIINENSKIVPGTEPKLKGYHTVKFEIKVEDQDKGSYAQNEITTYYIKPNKLIMHII